MAGTKLDIAIEIVTREAEKEFAREGGPKNWEELRSNAFWKPFHERTVRIINKTLSLPVTKSTGRAFLNAACRQLSGVRKRAPGGGRKPKVQPHVPSANETAAINSFLSGGGATRPARPFGVGTL